MSILGRLWHYCPKPLKRKSHVLAKLALSMRMPRSPNVDIIRISDPEKLVVTIYLFALAFPLLVLASYTALAKFPLLGPTIFQSQLVVKLTQYAFFLPFFITCLPFLIIPYIGSPPAIRLLPEPLGALLFFGSVALILFYLIACYFLWYRYRVAWILSFTVSAVTVAADAYECALGPNLPGAIALWVFGAAINFLILYLLWQCKSEFFKSVE
jgi:hypothetical protein